MGPNKTRETWEDSSAEGAHNMAGMEMAGVQPLLLGDPRQAIAPFRASFSSSEKTGLDSLVVKVLSKS